MNIPRRALNLELDRKSAVCRERAYPKIYEPRFEPLFRAVKSQEKHFRFIDIDIVIGLGSLCELYRICSSKAGSVKAGLLFDVEVSGRTIFLSKRDGSLSPAFQSFSRGYGLGFEGHCTLKPKCKQIELATYHRILNYEFGSLNLLVQCESDAAIGEEITWPESFESLDGFRATARSSLSVLEVGKAVDPASIVEIKSRKMTPDLPMDDILVRLFFTGTARMLLGRHSKGRFKCEDIELLDMECDVLNWADQNRRTFAILCGFLGRVQALTIEEYRETSCQRFTLFAEKNKTRLFRRSGGTSIVPEELAQEILEGQRTSGSTSNTII